MLLYLISPPALVTLLVVHVLHALVIELSSIAINPIGTFFVFGSIAGWIKHTSFAMIWQTVGISIFFFIAPHIAGWLNEKDTRMFSNIASNFFVFIIFII